MSQNDYEFRERNGFLTVAEIEKYCEERVGVHWGAKQKALVDYLRYTFSFTLREVVVLCGGFGSYPKTDRWKGEVERRLEDHGRDPKTGMLVEDPVKKKLKAELDATLRAAGINPDKEVPDVDETEDNQEESFYKHESCGDRAEVTVATNGLVFLDITVQGDPGLDMTADAAEALGVKLIQAAYRARQIKK